MLARPPTEHDDTPAQDVDTILLLHGATWADYQRHLEMRGERAAPRLAYLEGVLQIVSPSLSHERLKSVIGRLVEVWCLEKGIEANAFGGWTLERKEANRGAEPDECYVFSADPQPRRPDLAIEVVWTSGGLDKLDIYRKLDVPEVWFWRRGRLTVHVLRGDRYEETGASEVLAGIDLAELVLFLDRPTMTEAIRDYRASLQARR